MIGTPDAKWGKVVAAFVVLQAGAIVDAADIDAHRLAQMGRFKRPK